MIENFEEITHELTDFEEKELLPIMLKGLSHKSGVKNVVSNKQIKKGLENFGYKISHARIRKIIHFIRVNHLIENLIANSKGYYIAVNEEEVKTFVKSLQQRINSIQTVKHSFIKEIKQ